MIDPKELSALIEGDVDAGRAALDAASHDASIFEVRPEVVASPKSVGDVQKLVRYADDAAVAAARAGKPAPVTLTARSAGTDMGGGPLSESIVVSFVKYFDRVLKVAPPPAGASEGGYAVTQPGVYFRDFDKATRAEGGQILPSYPASRELCTVGGIVSNNSGGEKTLTYGKTQRYVRRLKVVLADGKEAELRPLAMSELEQHKKFPTLESEIYRKMHELISANYDIIQKARPIVSKNSCGYYLWDVWDKEKGIFDLTKLVTGAQGTLCLTTEIELGLVVPKPHSRMLVIFLKDIASLGDIAARVLEFKPESFESYDDHTFKVAMKFLPTLMKRMKGNLFTLGLQFLPEIWAVLKGGVPKMVLMAEFTADTPEEALRQATAAQAALDADAAAHLHGLRHVQTQVTKTAKDADKYWVIRRESFNMLRQHVKKLRTAPFIDDFVVPPQTLPAFLPKLYGILDQYKSELTYTIAGHIGDGNFHIIPLMDLGADRAHKIIEDLSVKVYSLVHEFNGSITGEHNDGIIRTPFVKMQYGDAVYKLFEETKRIWDPKGIFNPGKKVGGTLDYAFKHIVKST